MAFLTHNVINNRNVYVIRAQHSCRFLASACLIFRSISERFVNRDLCRWPIGRPPSHVRLLPTSEFAVHVLTRIFCHLRMTVCLPSRYRVEKLEVLMSLMSTLLYGVLPCRLVEPGTAVLDTEGFFFYPEDGGRRVIRKF